MSDKNILVQAAPIVNYTIVEVPVTANGLGQVPIPDQPMLKSFAGHIVVIKSIELITAKVLTNAPLSGNTTAARAEIIKASLVLYSDGWEKLQYFPLARLIAARDSDSLAATTIPFSPNTPAFENLRSVDWTKSYVKYSNTLVSAAATYSFVFGVQYVVLGSGDVERRP